MMHTLLQSDLCFSVLFSSFSNLTSASASFSPPPPPSLPPSAASLRSSSTRSSLTITSSASQGQGAIPHYPHRPLQTLLEVRPPDDITDLDLESLSAEVERLMRDVIRISNRLNGKNKKDVAAAEGEGEEVHLRKGQFSTMFSFFVGSTFEGASREQQALLEIEDTGARLRREKEMLRNTLNYLTATAEGVGNGGREEGKDFG